MSDPAPTPWWNRARHADRRPFLIARTKILQAVRTWFLAQDFIEVEPTALQISPGNETHLHAFKTHYQPLDGSQGRDFYLHTSPEFACKKLLAAGETRIFTLTPAYRNREHGRLHHPEFTMLEWYRAGANYTALMADCADLLAVAADAAGSTHFVHDDNTILADTAPNEISVADAFAKFANVDLRATYTPTSVNREALARAAAGIRIAPDDTWSDIFWRLVIEKIEPALGRTAPTILKEYPVHEAALAKPARHDAMIAERFELYLAGMELANAFTELTDVAEQRRRFERAMDEKHRLYGERVPIDEDFLAALAHMPPAAGCALGFDRLVMAATGADHINQVLWTPLPLEG